MSVLLTKWLLFTILLPLVPLVAGFIAHDSGSGGATVVSVVAGGQLLLIGVALAGRSIGELMPGSKEYGLSVTAVCGLALLVLLMSSFYYGWLFAHDQVSGGRTALYSAGLYTWAVLVSLACAIVARKVDHA